MTNAEARELLTILEERGVREWHDGETHIVLAPKPSERTVPPERSKVYVAGLGEVDADYFGGLGPQGEGGG